MHIKTIYFNKETTTTIVYDENQNIEIVEEKRLININGNINLLAFTLSNFDFGVLKYYVLCFEFNKDKTIKQIKEEYKHNDIKNFIETYNKYIKIGEILK